MNLTSIEKEWLLLYEISFHKNIWEYVSQKGDWQGIFPAIVQYNTSHYLLKNINKNNLIYDLIKQNKRITLCVSEDNWKGKIQNIKSELYQNQNEFFCNIQKSYVFKAGLYIVITNVRFAIDKIAILLLNDNYKIQFIIREEEFSKFYNINRQLIMDHYKMFYQGSINNRDVIFLSKEEYKKLFYLIPLREISTLCLVLLGLYYFENTSINNQLIEIELLKNQLLDLRKTITYKDTKEIVIKIIPYLNQIQKQDPQFDFIKKMIVNFRKI